MIQLATPLTRLMLSDHEAGHPQITSITNNINHNSVQARFLARTIYLSNIFFLNFYNVLGMQNSPVLILTI